MTVILGEGQNFQAASTKVFRLESASNKRKNVRKPKRQFAWVCAMLK